MSVLPNAIGSGNDEIVESFFNDRDQLVSIDSDNDENDAIYTYDANASTISVITDPEGTPVMKNYQWDLRNRMVALDMDGNGEFDDTDDVLFGYDHNGTRTSRTIVDGEETIYLQDKNNPTGYSQILEEKETAEGDPTVSYIIGLDVIGQQYDAGDIEYLGYDGHGSVRMLIQNDGTLVPGAVYDYDAYGNALGFDPTTAGTSLLYTGEFFDKTVEQYVLRARYYDASIGRFSSFDSYEGSSSDPASLHKYTYVHANPVNGIDPSGMFISGLIDTALVAGGRLTFETVMFSARHAPAISKAATLAGALSLISGVQLALEQNGFVPQTGYTGYVFAVSSAIFTLGLSLQAINQHTVAITTPIRNTKNGELINGITANARTGLAQPPYKPDSLVAEGKIAPGVDLVRVHVGTNVARAWVMQRSDILGLTARQIQDRWAIPYTPTHISSVHAANVSARVGFANEVPRWGKGGGLQIELLDVAGAKFTNTRPLPPGGI